MKFWLSIIFFLLINAINCMKYGDDLIKIDTSDYNGNSSELIYMDRLILSPQSFVSIEIDFLTNTSSKFAFSILQIHSFYLNVSVENKRESKNSQQGTNLGISILPSNSTRTFRLNNINHDEVECMLAFIIYKKTSPVPGGCNMEGNLSTLSLKITESDNLVIAKIPPAKGSSCDKNQELNYETFYTYIDPLNFAADSYFDGIQRMLFDDIYTTYKAKKSPTNVHEFEKISGRGLVINTVVRNRNGEVSYYIPSVTYSCPENSWNTHCSDVNFLGRAIALLLAIHSVVMILNLLAPDLIEAILNGMLVGGFITIIFIKSNQLSIQGFDYFITVIIGAFFIAAVFGTCALYLPIGRYLTKLMFSCFLMAFVMEFFFEELTSPYAQFIFALMFSIALHYLNITFSAFFGGLILIANVSYLIKIGNIHRILISNFLSLTTLPTYGNENYFDFFRSNFINYKAPLNLMDYLLLLIYLVGAIGLTIRKEKYFFEHPSVVDPDHIFSDSGDVHTYNCDVARRRRNNCIVGIERRRGQCNLIVSRCRRHHHYFRSNVINERSPLISHWLASEEGDDEVFESPESNARFMQRLSPESQERLNAIQNFEDRE